MGEPPTEITMPVVEAASEALDTPITDLPPLRDFIDLDGLNELVSETPSQDVTVTFTYAGLHVTVHSGQIVYARPLHRDSTMSRKRTHPDEF